MWLAGALGSFFGNRLLLIGLPIVMAIVGGGGYIWWKEREVVKLEEETIALREEISEMKLKVEQLDALNTNLKKLTKKVQETQVALNQKEETIISLRKKLLKHDLTELSKQKPGLIENRINDGTKKEFDEIEDISQ